VIVLLERLRLLWTHPVDAHDDAEAAFREVYAGPVTVNGTQIPVTALVDRASSLQRPLTGWRCTSWIPLRRPIGS
jgi:hypothetical protein